MEKSHVAMEQHQCPICLETFDTGNILLETRFEPQRFSSEGYSRGPRELRKTLDPHQLTGHSPCPDCQKKLDDGFVACVETAEERPIGETIARIEIARSGNIVWIKQPAFTQIFSQPVPNPPMIFIEPGVLEKIASMMPTKH